jgi:AcrR family transcriptional regulator
MFTGMNASANTNLNDARSQATRARLVNSAIASLVDVGFTRTTGVEVCRRAALTRGALNHHFPDFVELFIAALHTINANLLNIDIDALPAGQQRIAERDVGQMERFVMQAHSRISKPEFKALIELWLASRNDQQFGARIAAAIANDSSLFTPESVLADGSLLNDPALKATYRSIFEALIGLGLGRAVGYGEAVEHEQLVIDFLLDIARRADAKD